MKELLFLGLARNCKRYLENFYAHMGHLEERGFSCSAIIGENGSRDGTRASLMRAREQNPNLILIDTSEIALLPNRLQRMAIGREMLLKRAKERAADCIIVCDLDEVMNPPPSPRDVLHAVERLERTSGLFAVGATSRPYFYDLLALRIGATDYSTVHANEIAMAKLSPLTYYRFQRDQLYSERKRMTRDVPIGCISSFNGYCIYRAADYLAGSYRSSREDQVCEHVTMNEGIYRSTAKTMLIVPELKVRTPHEHMPVGFLRFWWDRLVKQLQGTS